MLTAATIEQQISNLDATNDIDFSVIMSCHQKKD